MTPRVSPLRTLAHAALAAALLLTATAAAQTRRSGRTAARPPARPAAVPLTGELAGLFPANTVFYLEVKDLTSIFDRGGSLEQVYNAVVAQFLHGPRAQKPPLTLAEVRTLLSSRLALGVLVAPRDAAAGPGNESRVLTVLRTPSAAATAMVKRRVLPLILPKVAQARLRTQVVHGQSITIYSPAAPASPVALAISGDTIVFGQVDAVTGLFASVGSPDAKTLAGTQAYVDARGRLSEGAQVFAYANSGEIVGMISQGVASNALKDTSGEALKRAILIKQFTDFIGVDSVRGIGVAIEAGESTGRYEAVVELDRSKESLISTLASAPAITLKAASMLPAGTDIVGVVSFEPGRVYDFTRQHLAPEAARAGGWQTIDEFTKQIEAQVHLKLREEVIASLGNEAAIGIDMTPTIESIKNEAQTGPAPPRVLGVIEVKQPETARTALSRLLAASVRVEVTERDRNGVTIAQAGQFACAVVDNLAVIGQVQDVERALDAHRSGDSIAASPAFAPLRAELTGDTVVIAFVSPHLAESVAEALKGTGMFPEGALQVRSDTPTLVTVGRDPLGLYAKIDLAGSGAFALAGIGAAITIPSLMASRNAANESGAIGNLRSISIAETTYAVTHQKYATLADLVAANLLDSSIVDGAVLDGYRFTQVAVTADTFEFKAEPLGIANGSRSFNVTQDLIIRYAAGSTAPKGTDGKEIGQK